MHIPRFSDGVSALWPYTSRCRLFDENPPSYLEFWFYFRNFAASMRKFIKLLVLALLLAGCDHFRPFSGSGASREAGSIDIDSITKTLKFRDETSAEHVLALIDSLESAGRISDYVANAQRTHIYFDRQQYRTADYYGEKALSDDRLYEKHRRLYYETCQYMISTAADNGFYKKGLDQTALALEKSGREESAELKVFEPRFLAQMGMFQMRLGRVKEGVKSCDESYLLFEKLIGERNSWDTAYLWYRSVGEAVQHFAVCDLETALAWLPRMDQTFQKAMEAEDVPPMMRDYCLSKLELTKAEIYMKAGDRKTAEQHFQAYQQTDIAKSGEDWISPQQYYENARDWNQLLAICNRWDSLCQANSMPMNREYQQVLSEKFNIELVQGRKDQALQTAERIVDGLASVDSLNKSDDASQLAVIYEIQKKESKIAEQEASLARQQLLAVAIAFALVAVFFVIYSLYRRKATRRLSIAHERLQNAYGQLEETTKAKERIESELRIARDIQQSMVPSVFPERDDLDLFASMSPAREVGGDLYDYMLEGDNLYFCVGDVSGKGVPASLFMAQTIRLFRTFAKQGMMPAEMATCLNAELTEGNDSGMFVTMFIGLVNLFTGRLYFCNAGHNPPVIGGDARHGSFLSVIPNAPIGLWPRLEYEGEQLESLKGRPLFIYSDGLNEAENRALEQFGDDRLLAILQTMQFENTRQVISRMAEEVEKHRDGAEPNDDLTMMCLWLRPEKN